MLKYSSICLLLILLVSCKHEEAPVKPVHDSTITKIDTGLPSKVVVRRDSADSANTAYDGRPDPFAWNRIPGTPMHINMLADYGHIARMKFTALPEAMQFQFTYPPELVAKLLRLPQEDHPADPALAIKVWMAETPPRIGIPPHLVVGATQRLLRKDKSQALFQVLREGEVMGTLKLSKLKQNNDSIWVVSEVIAATPQKPAAN
jgi:hypothetical protein